MQLSGIATVAENLRQRRTSQNVERGRPRIRIRMPDQATISLPETMRNFYWDIEDAFIAAQDEETARRIISLPRFNDPEIRRTREAFYRRRPRGNIDQALRTIEASEAQTNVDRNLNQRMERSRIERVEAEERQQLQEFIDSIIHPSGRARRGRDY